MSTKLVNIDIQSPGLFGINSQNKSIEDLRWASAANNAVIDAQGRLSPRKGWIDLTTIPIVGSYDILSLGEYVDATGAGTIVSSTAYGLYYGTITPINVSGATSQTDGYWKFQNFNNVIVGFQGNHTPVVWTGSGNFSHITPGSGTVPTGNEVLAAFGRLWAVKSDTDKTVIRYSDTLQYDVWDDHATPGAAGLLDLKTVWQGDQIVALADFNGYLLIFGKNTILVYQNPWDPTNMTLVEQIHGVGCIARDSVQNTGTDLIFLSNAGLLSFKRTIQEKSMPVVPMSNNVRDVMLAYARGETAKKIKSVYSESEGFYLLIFPTSEVVFVFDTRFPLADGSLRTTTWTGINPKSVISSVDSSVYFGFGGVVGKYSGYLDDASTYLFSFYSPWFTMGEGLESRVKIPKKITAAISGGESYTLTFSTRFDYNEVDSRTSTFVVPVGTSAAEFNIAEFNVDEFSGSVAESEAKTNLYGYGKTVQVGVSTTINGAQFSLQKLSILMKLGNLR